MKRTGAVSFLFCLALASCSVDGPVTNTILFKLDFGGGVTLSSVDYVLTGPGDFRRVGTLPVGDEPTVTATFQNLPAGQGYNIRVRGTATDDSSGCQGELMFNVTSSMTATLNIPLTCHGLVAVTGSFNSCPVVDSLSAIPAEVRVGSSIDLAAEVHDSDNGPSPIAAVWVTSGGAISNLSTTGATFTCMEVGTFMVGLKVSDGTGNKCQDASKVTLTCTPAPSAALMSVSPLRRESV